MEAQAAIDELQRQLRTYAADRYPVQHATAQFHLGVALLGQDRVEEAVAALRAATGLFEPLPVERAKAQNMLGAALRARGEAGEAARCLSAAAATFETAAHAARTGGDERGVAGLPPHGDDLVPAEERVATLRSIARNRPVMPVGDRRYRRV